MRKLLAVAIALAATASCYSGGGAGGDGSGDAADAGSNVDDADVDDVGEGSIDYPPGQPDVDELPGADVTGYVVRVDGTLTIVADPALGAPVEGATVAFANHGGEAIRDTTTDLRGFFSVDDMDRGPISATASAGDDDSAPLFFSSLPDSTVLLGEVWPVDWYLARSYAGVRDSSTELILGVLQPLPANTLVAPRREDPLTSRFATTIEEPSWLFVFDATPFEQQQHSLRYVFVDAVTGEVTEFVDAPDWPRINRGVYFTDDFMWIAYNDVDWDRAFETGELPEDEERVVAAEVISMPGSLPAELTNNGGGMQKAGDPSARDVFVAMLIAGNDSAASADRVRMWGWCNREGIPIGNRRVVIPNEIARIRDVPTEWATALRELEELVATRLDEGADPTLVVYVTGHGLLENGTPARQLRVDWKDREMEWSAANIDVASLISNTSACRLRVIFDVCYAETLALDLEVRTTRRPTSERPDFFSLSSSVSDQKSIMIPGWLDAIAGAGSVFTKRFAEHVSIVAADLSGALAAGNSSISENLDPAGQTPIAHVSSNWPTRCDDTGGTDTGVSLDAGDPGLDVSADASPHDVAEVDAVDTRDADEGATRRVSVLTGPEGIRILPVGGAPFVPAFAQRLTDSAHAIVGCAGGIDLVNLATGGRVSNAWAPANFAAVPFRDPREYDSFLLPSSGGLAMTSWNAESGDFGFTQVDPGGRVAFDVDVLAPSEGGVSQGYVYAASSAAIDSSIVIVNTYDAELGYMTRGGEVTSDAFPDSVWPAAPFGAYFGRTADEAIVTLLDGSIWYGPFSAPYNADPRALTRLGAVSGEPRGLRCDRGGAPIVCALPSYAGDQLAIIELDDAGVRLTVNTTIVAEPVGIDVRRATDGTVEIVVPSFSEAEVAIYRYAPDADELDLAGVADACGAAGHAAWLDESTVVVSCHDANELLLLERAAFVAE